MAAQQAYGGKEESMKLLARAFRGIARWFDSLGDPVCQDWSAQIYADYRGRKIRLVPVAARDSSRIETWIPDPLATAGVDAAIARAEAEKAEAAREAEKRAQEAAERPSSVPPVIPADDERPEPPQTVGDADGINPNALGGL